MCVCVCVCVISLENIWYLNISSNTRQKLHLILKRINTQAFVYEQYYFAEQGNAHLDYLSNLDIYGFKKICLIIYIIIGPSPNGNYIPKHSGVIIDKFSLYIIFFLLYIGTDKYPN